MAQTPFQHKDRAVFARRYHITMKHINLVSLSKDHSYVVSNKWKHQINKSNVHLLLCVKNLYHCGTNCANNILFRVEEEHTIMDCGI